MSCYSLNCRNGETQMTFTQFISHLAANKRHLAPAVAEQIRQDARQRLVIRWEAGRADCILDFTDLVNRIEAAICR